VGSNPILTSSLLFKPLQIIADNSENTLLYRGFAVLTLHKLLP